jgi:hypothetical protein
VAFTYAISAESCAPWRPHNRAAFDVAAFVIEA